MQHAGVMPDDITFMALLSTFSHAGLVGEGWKYFDCMRRDYHITPSVEHYACMVDLLGRAGHLDEAWNFIMVFFFDIIIFYPCLQIPMLPPQSTLSPFPLSPVRFLAAASIYFVKWQAENVTVTRPAMIFFGDCPMLTCSSLKDLTYKSHSLAISMCSPI